MKIIEILRLTEQGYSQREIAKSVKCGKSTVGEIQKRCRNSNLKYASAATMTNDEIKTLLYPKSFGHSIKKDPDWPSIHERLQTNKRLNLQYLWEEYKADNANGLSYSRFCKRYLDWKNETGKNVIMIQNREPGKELFVDWMGDPLDCVVDSSTREVLTAHFFVATLGDSSYPYVEAFPDEKLDRASSGGKASPRNGTGFHPHYVEYHRTAKGEPRPVSSGGKAPPSQRYRVPPAFCRIFEDSTV